MLSFLKKYGGFFLLFGGIIGIGALNVQKATRSVEPAITTSRVSTTAMSYLTVDTLKQSASTGPEYCYVDIKGAVLSPGVYMLEAGSRIFQALALAGGVLSQADTSAINLSQTVFDEMVIYVPEIAVSAPVTTEPVSLICVQIRGEVNEPRLYYLESGSTLADLINLAGGLCADADISGLDFSQVLCSGYSVVIPKYDPEADTGITDPGASETDTSGLVNINEADLDELMTLHGIGMVLGQRIIDYRAEYGDFSAIEDIMYVSGIKESIYEDIKDFITVADG